MKLVVGDGVVRSLCFFVTAPSCVVCLLFTDAAVVVVAVGVVGLDGAIVNVTTSNV